MLIRILTLTGVVALAALSATAALAQTPRANRPYRGLFGGGVGDTGELLTLSGDANVGYDSRIWVGGPTATTANVPQQGSASGGGSAGLSYSLSRTRVSFSASANSGVSYYRALPNPLVVNRSGSLGASFTLSKSTELTANESVAYQPYYALASFPGLVGGPFGQSFGQPLVSQSALLENHRTSQTGVSMSQRLSRRVDLSFSYLDTRSRSASGALDVSTQNESGHLNVNIAKGLGVKAGYGYMGGSYGAAGSSSRAQAHTVDAGLDFSRALSFSRRMTLSFGTGSSAFKYQNQTRYFLTGNAHLTREIGRSWDASLVYVRSAEVVDSFRQPVISDSLSANLGGLINRRMQFHSSAGMALGNVGLSSAGNGFRAYYGSSGLTIGVTRLLALGLNYTYSRYRFDANVNLPLGLPGQMDRNSVRLHLDLWVPLINRTRSPNAAR